jgi:hypothetical protein
MKECKCFRLGEGSKWQTYLCDIHNENLKECLEIVDKKSYSIEEIERAIEEHFDKGIYRTEHIKQSIINNLKK